MKEIIDSMSDIIKNRLTNSLYGTFLFSWVIFHWNFVFSFFFLDDTKILQLTGLLKNDYLQQTYFNIKDWYFWFSWIMPFVLTYIIIWKLPRWILIKAYEKTEEYEVEKKIIKISQQRRIEQEETKLQEQTVKKITAVAKQTVEENKIKNLDPTFNWDNEYFKFRNSGYNIKYSNFLNHFYSGYRSLNSFNANEISYFHALGLIEIEDNSLKIITEKGKFFALKVKEELRN